MGEMLTAEERRERRRRKVLENSENRISRILSAEGDEKRQAPMMEGGDFRSSKLAETVIPSSPSAATSRSINNNKSQLTSDWYDEMGVPQFETDMPWFTRSRVISSIVVGVLLRVCLMMGVISNVVVPWFLFQASIEIYKRYFSKNRKFGGYPIHGYIVNTALYLGFSEGAVVYGGIVWDVVSRILADTSVAFLAFYIAHLVV